MDFSFFPVDAELTADIVELALRKLSRSTIQTRTLSLIYCTIPNCKDTERKFVEKGWIPIAIFSSRCVVDKAGKNNHKRSFRTDLLLGYILMLFLHVCPWKFDLNIVCMLLYGLQVVGKQTSLARHCRDFRPLQRCLGNSDKKQIVSHGSVSHSCWMTLSEILNLTGVWISLHVSTRGQVLHPSQKQTTFKHFRIQILLGGPCIHGVRLRSMGPDLMSIPHRLQT